MGGASQPRSTRDLEWLSPGSLGAARLDPKLGELLGDVVCGESLALGSGSAPFEGVVGQVVDVGLDRVFGDDRGVVGQAGGREQEPQRE